MSHAQLAVITLTTGTRPAYLHQLCQSLVAALPGDTVHHIIECLTPTDFERTRWACRELADYLCFVDDDDRVINDSIRRCMKVLMADPGIGVAFTDQEMIDSTGHHIKNQFIGHSPRGTLRYESIATHIHTIHHLTILRSAAIDPACYQISQRADGVGLDWLMKASAALHHDAIHLPFYGYQWRRHPGNHSVSEHWEKRMIENGHILHDAMTAWSRTGPIPQG